MTNLPHKPSKIDFDAIDRSTLERILRGGSLDSLSEGERRYFDLMEMVRGLRARMTMPSGDRIVTKAGIIKLLKSDAYGLTDWMARQVYADTLNFFYSEDGVSTQAWANFYAERLDKLADMSVVAGRIKEAKGYIVEAAKLRGCYKDTAPEVPRELLDAQPIVIYANNPEDLGVSRADRNELEDFIDSLPEISDSRRNRVKEDAGIRRRNLYNAMIEDVKEYGEEDT